MAIAVGDEFETYETFKSKIEEILAYSVKLLIRKLQMDMHAETPNCKIFGEIAAGSLETIPVHSSLGQLVTRSIRHTVSSSQSTRHNLKLC